MEDQRPCSLNYIKDKIKEKSDKVEYITKLMNTTCCALTLQNMKNKIDSLKMDIDVLYDYAFLRFGINLKLID